MESNIECVSSVDGLDEDEISHPHPFSRFASPKPYHNNTNNNNVNGGVINPATSVHELLECPVCTNSMYPPIHQVCYLASYLSFCVFLFLSFWKLPDDWYDVDWIFFLIFLINGFQDFLGSLFARLNLLYGSSVVYFLCFYVRDIDFSLG